MTSGIHQRPTGHMLPIAGDRDDTCGLYDMCLTAHVVAHRKYRKAETDASCPKGCRWREDRSERATDYMQKTDPLDC